MCGQAVPGFWLLPLAARAQEKGTAGTLAELEKWIPKLMEELHVPGVSMSVIANAKLHWRRAFGVTDRATQKPVDHDTVFEAASVSKTVFAYAALKLVEKGEIGLDTPLTNYAARPFLESDARLKRITPRHVLSHTTGFQNVRSSTAPLKIHFTPGEKYSYSGEGYYYLQSVMTQLTGQVNTGNCAKFEDGLEVCATDIDSYLKKNLLLPFGMTSSGYVWSDGFEKHTARPHDGEGKPWEKKKPNATAAARYAAMGDLHTTPTDYAKFLIEVINPKPNDAFRLSAESLKEMVRPQVKVDERHSWGLGWQICHRKKGDLIQHEGNNRGFHAFAAASIRRKSGFIIMTNGENGWKLNRQVFERLMEAYLLG